MEQRRRAAGRGLIAFTEFTFPKYQAAVLHWKIAAQLERVLRGEIDRLMLHVPPRCGKSELASRRFPAYYLGHHPDKQFISASASSPLAEDFGREVRNIVSSQEYAQVFDTRLSEDSQAKGSWKTQQGGSYYAVGIGGDIMGRGAHVAIIDDPFGNMADAQSPAMRKQVWDWYTGTLYNRLEDKGAIVVINHRMHEDDLSGMLLGQQASGGDKWEVVEFKAIDDDGRAIWPEKYDIDALNRIRINTTPRNWSALYQQNPVPDDGNYFQVDWLRPYNTPPALETMFIYGASDYAVTDQGGDYTVHVVVGCDPQDRLWLLDLWRGQTTTDKWIEAWCDLVEMWKPMGWAEESGQINLSVGPFLEKRAYERKTYVARRQFPSRANKAIRAQSIRGRMAMNGLYVPMNAKWYPDFRAELLSFPAGKHDDMVDAISLIGQILDLMISGHPATEKELPKMLSTDPAQCTLTLTEVFEDNERQAKRSGGRI